LIRSYESALAPEKTVKHHHHHHQYYLASCGMCSWYHHMAQGLRQISNRFEFESTSRLTDSLKELHLRQWTSNLQQGGTKAATYHEVTYGAFKTRAYTFRYVPERDQKQGKEKDAGPYQNGFPYSESCNREVGR
jgi:hypothetical protein